MWSESRKSLTHTFYRMDRPGSWLWYEGRKIHAPLIGDNFTYRREISVNLLKTCRKIHDEALPLCYGKASFGFWSRRLLERFLSTIGLEAKRSITKLLIQHETYGDPYSTQDIRWKITHDLKWEACCDMISQELLGLCDLTILLKVNDRPLILNLTASWAPPLLMFQDKGLEHFRLEILAKGIDSHTTPKLRSCARVFERAILGSEYMEEDLNKRKDRKHLSNSLPKARKCLVIRW